MCCRSTRRRPRAGNPDWHRAIPGFKIAGNLYYVGTADLAVYLIATPQGNILINSDFKEDVPAIRKSIEGLGFKYADTKILLISHAHGDHDEGVGVIKSDTGAQLMVMDADVAAVESTAPGRPGAKVDRVAARSGHGRTRRREAHGAPHARSHARLHHVDDAGGRRRTHAERRHRRQPERERRATCSWATRNYPQIAGDYVKTFARAEEPAGRSVPRRARRVLQLEGQAAEDERGGAESVHRSRRLQGVRRGAGTGVREGAGEADGRAHAPATPSASTSPGITSR